MIATRLRRAAMVALVLLPVCAVCGRVLHAGWADLGTAEDAMQSGLDDTALTFYGKAARWYLPVLGPQERARDGLERLAARHEAAGRPAEALRCLREARGTLLGTRWLGPVDSERLDRVNAGIVRLAALEPPAPGAPGLAPAAHAELLARDLAPSPVRSALAIVLFLGWLAVTAAGAWRFVTPEGVIRGRQVLVWLPASLVLLVLWLAVLRFA